MTLRILTDMLKGFLPARRTVPSGCAPSQLNGRGDSRLKSVLSDQLVRSFDNNFGADNWDPDRFGPYEVSPDMPADLSLEVILSKIENAMAGLQESYDLLADDYSRSMLAQVLAYRLLGPRKVRLPLNTAAYWAKRKSLELLIRGTEVLDPNFLGMTLRRMDFNPIEIPIQMYFGPLGTMTTFVLRQYEYDRADAVVRARPGDYVIDGGGCWGDTALFFAHEVGERGKVFSFEFMPANIEIPQRNVNLNPGLKNRIQEVPKALWRTSGEKLAYQAFGPATTLMSGDQLNRITTLPEVETISIDDFVREERLPHVDFVKMDIEGAELDALRGAEQTVRAFRPNLAIAIYHRDADFVDIPRYLRNLDLGYRFYLDHFTIYGEETVLFASTRPERSK